MKNKIFLPLLALSLSTTLLLTACGGGSSKKEPVVKKDTKAPLLTLKGKNPLTIPLNKVFADPGATAIDDKDGDISKKISQTNTINVKKAGCYSQQYTILDAAKNKSTIKRRVFVGTDKERHSPNHLPKAIDDAVTTIYNKPTIINVLKNDSDIDCDSLKVVSITQPINGVAKLNADNTISFDPKGVVGSHAFTYTLSDFHKGTTTSSVTIASHDPKDGNNAWPDLVKDNITTKKGTQIFIDVLKNDTDADGDAIILDMVDQPHHGTTTKNSSGVLYTPKAGFTGKDTFYYGAHDNHGHNGSALVTITVRP